MPGSSRRLSNWVICSCLFIGVIAFSAFIGYVTTAPTAVYAASQPKARACPPGYVVLDKPNKYGAFCEPREGFCPADRPLGTPPNCCAQGTVFREGACYPESCGPLAVGTPPHCQRICGPGKIVVGQTCYDPCPAGTTGTPPDGCRCPPGHVYNAAAKACVCPAGSFEVVKNGTKSCAKPAPPPPPPPPPPKQAKPAKPQYQEICVWVGTAPKCEGRCSGNGVYQKGSSDYGDGGYCVFGKKVYCCQKVKIF